MQYFEKSMIVFLLTVVILQLYLGHGGAEVRHVLAQQLLQPPDVVYGAPQRLHLAALALQVGHVLLQLAETLETDM